MDAGSISQNISDNKKERWVVPMLHPLPFDHTEGGENQIHEDGQGLLS